MKKNIPIFLTIMLLIPVLNVCIDPYYPKLEKYDSLLVVDALLTDEEKANFVMLSRSSEFPNKPPVMVTDAEVSIIDDLGNVVVLPETSPGVYKTDSLNFRGVAGRAYTLRISTPDGKEYASEPEKLIAAREIDRVYFERDSRTTDDGEYQEGITIFIDAEDPTEAKHFKWSYEEWWKFMIPYPVEYKYFSSTYIPPIPIENVTCYNNHKSVEVLIKSGISDADTRIVREPILFIASDKSNRLLIQYYIEVSQYTISEKEYEFWRQMQEINESGGDIFDKQPFSVISNLHSVSDPGEKVLGYFRVCGGNRQKILVTPADLESMDLPPYHYDCEMVSIGPGDFLPPPPTFDQLYGWYTGAGYNFIAPVYGDFGRLVQLSFAKKFCSDCTETGFLNKPYFWEDIE